MHKVLQEINTLIHDTVSTHLKDVPLSQLEDNGTVWYMNGKNGTEFDWHVNGRLSDFFVFYNDKDQLGALKADVYQDGTVFMYVYTDHGRKLEKELQEKLDVSQDELLELAVILKNNADENRIWDSAVGSLPTDIKPDASEIRQFLDNRSFYEPMLKRKALLMKNAYVSRAILDEGWKPGYIVRDEPLHDNDSGWSFMAGNEDDEYINTAKNIVLLRLGQVCQLDPSVWKYIDSPVGTRMIRISSEEFEEDHNDKPIFMEKRN